MAGLLNYLGNFGDSVLRGAQEIVDDVAIASIKMTQPTIDFGYDLEPQMVALIRHVEDTFRAFEFLAEHNPEKLVPHTVTLLTGTFFGIVATALFFEAMAALCTALVGAPVYFSAAIVYLFISYGAGYLGVHLLREADAWIRYDSIKQGCKLLFA